MPERCKLLVGHDKSRRFPRRCKETASAVCVEESSRLICISYTVDILPRVIKVVRPSLRFQLRSVLGIVERPPQIAHAAVCWPVHISGR